MKRELVRQARKAMENAYAPYSKFKVGAALLTKDNKIYTGCNVENASYSATVCAERVAVYNAVKDGYTEFSMLAVAGGKEGKITDGAFPCGICRQVLSEFNKDDIIILIATENGFLETTLNEILPNQFKL